jgi:hypothetical protein
VSTEWNTEPCRNCGNTGAGRYCPQCGQRKGEVRVSLRRMLADVLEDQLSINATLPRTLQGILFRPGRLTLDYLNGRIASYIPPFRLYLAASVLFFLTLSIGSRTERFRVAIEQQQADTTVTRPTVAEAGAAVRAAIDSAREAGARPGDRAPPDSTPSGVPDARHFFGLRLLPQAPGDARPWTERIIVRTGLADLDALVMARVRELGALPAEEAMARISGAIIERIPTAMFILLPVFAALLKLLYIRRRRFYVEHFVFALHYHAFAFLGFTLMRAMAGTPVRGALGVWMGVYLWLALKRVYGQGFLRTSAKWIALSWGYLAVLVLGLLATAVAAVLML